MKPTKYQIIIAITTIVVIAVNALANILPFNGISTGEVSDTFKTYFVPAGYVFSIWGVIYLLQLVFSFAQGIVPQKERTYIEKITPWYVLSGIVNCLWVISWHYGFFLTTVSLMLTLFYSLVMIYLVLKENSPKSISERLVIHLPFQVYLGWISVALIANVSDVLWLLGWNGFGITGNVWAAIMMLIAGLLGAYMVLTLTDYGFGLVIIWALIGIIVKFPSENIMMIAGIIGMLLIIAAIAKKAIIKREPLPTKTKKEKISKT